jgi:uncharacterized protein YjbJ (UPF0337 family)
MKESTRNEVEGKIHEVKGTIKQKVAQITDNPKLKSEGVTENLAGHIQDKVGQVEKVVEKP